MEELMELLPSLTAAQVDALRRVAAAMLYSQPREQDEYMTVAQISEEYDKSKSAVYKAMNKHHLPYVTPHGQTKPRASRREDVLRWLGRL